MQTRKLEYLYKTIDVLWHGVVNTNSGDYPKIINLYKEVLKIKPDDRDAWENMIWLMWSLSVNESSESWLKQAEIFAKRYLSVMPNGYRSFEYLGMFYRSMKIDLRLAMRYYESAIRWKDAPPSTYYSLISICDKTNDKIKALDYCYMALKKYKNDAYVKSKIESYR